MVLQSEVINCHICRLGAASAAGAGADFLQANGGDVVGNAEGR